MATDSRRKSSVEEIGRKVYALSEESIVRDRPRSESKKATCDKNVCQGEVAASMLPSGGSRSRRRRMIVCK